jgi:hypothetical protein
VNGAPASSTFYYTVSFTGSAIATMSVNGTESTTPGIMGAGTFTDTITVTVCNDSKCASPVTGSPAKILITYVVTGNPVPNTLFTPENGSFILEAPTSSSGAPTTTTTITTINLPPTGAYAFASIGTGSAVASATVQSNLNGTGTLTIAGKPPASLGSGIYQDSVALKLCFDTACTKPAAHTPFIFPVTYIVDASANVDFTVQTIPLQVFEMYWSSVNQRIYATSPSYAVANPNSLTGQIAALVSIGSMTAASSIRVATRLTTVRLPAALRPAAPRRDHVLGPVLQRQMCTICKLIWNRRRNSAGG